MEKRIGILVTALLVSITVHAQGNVPAATPVTEAPSRHNSKVVIKTEPLRNNTIDVELNGRRIASMEGEQTYTGVFSPGRMRITVPGGKPEGSIEFIAEPNKEYIFNVAYVGSPSAPGFLLFGLIGAMAMADHSYSIVLKETREMFVKPPHSVVAENLAAPTHQPTQQGIQHLQAQSAAIRNDTPPEKPPSTTSRITGTDKDIQTAQRLVVAEPSNARAWRELASQYQAVGESDKAIRAYQEALRLEPSDVETLEKLGALYAKTGQKENVRKTWASIEIVDKAKADAFFNTYILP